VVFTGPLAVRAILHGASKIATDKAYTLDGIEVDRRMYLATRESFDAMGQCIDAGCGRHLWRNAHGQIGVDHCEEWSPPRIGSDLMLPVR
jgi:hypothetical protein